MRPVIGDGVEVEIEGAAGPEPILAARLLPGGQELRSHRVIDPRGFPEVERLLGIALSPAAKPSSATSAMMWLLRSIDQSLRAKADRSAWPAGSSSTLEARGLGQLGEVEAHQPRQEQEEPPQRVWIRRAPARTRGHRPRVPRWPRRTAVHHPGDVAGAQPFALEHFPDRRWLSLTWRSFSASLISYTE